VICGWTADALGLVDAAAELEIAVPRADGSLRPWTPIWVVRVGDEVYVRSWYRRDTGWFGDAVRSGRARIRVPGLEAEVTVADVGVADGVDEAYRAKYRDAGSMVTSSAASTTLRLDPAFA
jgi:hypothetical protein